MSKPYVFIFCIIQITIVQCVALDIQRINFIRDFLAKEPLFLNAFICSNRNVEVSLVKTLSEIGVATSIRHNCDVSNVDKGRSIFLIDMSCQFIETCLKKANSLNLFLFPYKWLIIDNGGEHFEERWSLYLNDMKVLSDSEIIVATNTDDNEHFNLTYVYKRRLNQPIIIEDYGYWDKNIGIIDMRPKPIVAMRRLNQHRNHLTASLVVTNNRTFELLDDYRDKQIDTISRANYHVTVHLIDFMNATKNFSFVDTWGYVSKNGTVKNGMIREMVDGFADLGATPMFISRDRINFVEFITVTTPTTVAFVVRQPPLSYVSNIFLLPFRWSVWSTIGLLVLASCLVLYAVAKNDEKISDFNHCEHCKSRFDTTIPARWDDVCLVALGAVAQQGTTRELRSISGRITIVLIFFILMFLYTSYSANIVALLQSQSGSIKTLPDLLNSRIALGSEDTVYNRHYLPLYNDTVRKAIWLQKMSNKGEKPYFMSLEKGVARLRQGLFAFHMEVGVGYNLVRDTFHEDEKCGLEEIQYMDTVSPWYSIPRNSSFREMFKIGLRRLQENGMLSRETKKMYTKKPECSVKGGGRFVSVGLVEIRPALVWLSSGVAFSICVLLMEKIVRWKFPLRTPDN